MNERQREILRKARPQLVDKIVDVDGICDRLSAYDVLTESMVEEILIKGTRMKMVRQLLDIIPRRGKKAYDFFHQALVDTGNSDAADILKPEFAELTPEQKEMLNKSEPGEKTHLISEKLDPSDPDKLMKFTSIPKMQLTDSIKSGVNPLSDNENNSVSSLESSNMLIQEFAAVQPSNCSENTMDIETQKSESEPWTIPGQHASSSRPHSPPTSIPVSSSPENSSIPPEKPQTNTVEELDESWPSSEKHMSLNIKVLPSSEHIKVEMDNNMAYNTLNYKTPCRVVIMNCNTFGKQTGLPDRKNANSDATIMSVLLKKYGFDVTTTKNPTFEKVVSVLEKERTVTESKYSCFMLIIMSHGEGKTIYCNDGKEMNLDNFLELLDDEHFPSLKNKPKVILVQACQASVKKSVASEETRESEAKKSDSLENFDSLVSPQAVLRNDMFVARATLDEQAFYSDNEFGSKFIRAFIYVMQEVSHKEDLSRIMQGVNKLLGHTDTDIPAVQCASSLKKKFYFYASK